MNGFIILGGNMKASDKLKSQIDLKEKQIEQIRNVIAERDGLLEYKDNQESFGQSALTGKEKYFNYRIYFLRDEKISKSEFENKKAELDKLHEKNYESVKQLNSEIILLKGALERALFEEASKITPKNKNSTSRDFETELHDIITIVSSWENIEGSYTQSKLAAKMNRPRYYLTRLFKKTFTYYNHESTFKEHLIYLVRNGIDSVRRSESKNRDEKLSRLQHFLRCLTNDIESIGLTVPDRKGSSKIKGKIKRQY